MSKEKQKRIYNLRQWRFIRLAQLSAQPLCAFCGGLASQVDHIIPVNQGGDPFDFSNLQSLCQSCHSRKTASEDGGYGNKKGRIKVKGCRPDGTPLDPHHEWNTEVSR